MKILLVSPFLPSPPRFGGQRRIDGLARQLATRHDVSVLSFNATDEWEHLSLDETRTYCREVRTLRNYETFDASVKRKNQLRSLLSRYSYEHSLVANRRDFQRAFDEMLAAEDFDVVQIEFVQMAPFRSVRHASNGPLFVLDEHNIEYDILRRTAKASTGAARTVLQRVQLAQAGPRGTSGLAPVRRRHTHIGPRRTVATRGLSLVPNGGDPQWRRCQRVPTVQWRRSMPDSLVFFGAINYFPNADGVMYFVGRGVPHGPPAPTRRVVQSHRARRQPRGTRTSAQRSRDRRAWSMTSTRTSIVPQ